MYLRYYLNENGDRQYTLAVCVSHFITQSKLFITSICIQNNVIYFQTVDPSGKPTLSAHPGIYWYNVITIESPNN